MSCTDIHPEIASHEATLGIEIPSLLQAMDAIAHDDAPCFEAPRLPGGPRVVDLGEDAAVRCASMHVPDPAPLGVRVLDPWEA